MLLLVTLTLAFAAWAVFKVYNRHVEECASKIPGPKGYPIIGNLLLLRKVRMVDDILDLFKELCEKFETYGICKGWAGPFLHVTVFAPKYVEAIAHSPNSAHKGPLYNLIFGDQYDGFFITDDVHKWKVLRRPFIKLTTKNRLMNEQYNVFVKKAKLFVDHVREKRCGEEINVVEDLYLVSFDVFLENYLGLEPNELRKPRFYYLKNLNSFLEYTVYNSPKVYFLKKMKFKLTYPEAVEKSKAMFTQCYEWMFHVSSMREKKEGPEYFTDYLLKRQKEKGLTAHTMYKEIGDVLVAGTDTMAVTVASALCFLAMHPHFQELAYEEQVSIFGSDTQREPTFEELSLMEYLARVIKETSRYASPGMIYKHSRGDVDIGDYTIPKGTVIGIFIEKLHHSPKYWEKPREFYPDHFLPEQEAARPTYAYIPFGIGPRTCPAMQYAMVGMKIMLSHILRNFRITTSLKYENIRYQYKLLREFDCGYKITFTERSKCL